MSVAQISRDMEKLTLTVSNEYNAPIAKVWEMWANPRLLERWWGPPTYPATVVDHSLAPGGKVTYFMTSPEGDKFHGWWEVVSVDPPNTLVVKDGFGDENGAPNTEMPVTTMTVGLSERADGGTNMEIVSRYATLADLEKVLEMGMEEGISSALDQIDALLAEQSAG